jgi:hypothetical protein
MNEAVGLSVAGYLLLVAGPAVITFTFDLSPLAFLVENIGY